MLVERDPAFHQRVIGKKLEPALRRNRRVEDSDRASRGAARIGEDLFPQALLFAVEGLKRLPRHHHFTTDLEVCGHAEFFQSGRLRAKRNGTNRFHVGWDLFSGGAGSVPSTSSQASSVVLDGGAMPADK